MAKVIKQKLLLKNRIPQAKWWSSYFVSQASRDVRVYLKFFFYIIGNENFGEKRELRWFRFLWSIM